MENQTPRIKMVVPRRQSSMVTEFKPYFANPQFSDLVIRTRDREYNVHKVIIAARSAVFSRMLQNHWKEANEGAISLEDDDPLAIEMMHLFMYGYGNPTWDKNLGDIPRMAF